MTDPSAAAPLFRRALSEPTLHFLVLAGLLFAASAVLRSGDDRLIEMDPAEMAARIQEYELANGIVLAEAERRMFEEALVDERILFREALALGLEDDPRITDFLVQKMLHVLSADVIQPSDGELARFWEANRERYAPPPTVTLDELVIATSEPLPPGLLAQLEAGVPPDRLESPLPIRHGVLSDVLPGTLASIFGAAMAERISGAPEGAWIGPHRTVRGEHWLRVTGRTESVTLPLESVREQVRLDWIAEQEEERLEQRVAELRSRYRVVYRGGGGP